MEHRHGVGNQMGQNLYVLTPAIKDQVVRLFQITKRV